MAVFRIRHSHQADKALSKLQLTVSAKMTTFFCVIVNLAALILSTNFRISQNSHSFFVGLIYFSKYILARWEGKTDEEREEGLSAHCDIQSNVGSNGLLTVIEILITDECRFFPVRNDSGGYDWYYIPVGEFAVDLSNCADGEYEISSYLSGCYFGYIGVEGATGMYQDFEPKLTLYKRGDYVSTDWRIPLDDFDGVEEIEEANSVGSVRYYNLAGVESAEPQPGVNLKVTTWSDGSRTTEKIIK